MKISYDAETDALYIRLVEGSHHPRWLASAHDRYDERRA
jgi:uncharacterized protein YuzE